MVGIRSEERHRVVNEWAWPRYYFRVCGRGYTPSSAYVGVATRHHPRMWACPQACSLVFTKGECEKTLKSAEQFFSLCSLRMIPYLSKVYFVILGMRTRIYCPTPAARDYAHAEPCPAWKYNLRRYTSLLRAFVSLGGPHKEQGLRSDGGLMGVVGWALE